MFLHEWKPIIENNIVNMGCYLTVFASFCRKSDGVDLRIPADTQG